MRSDRSGCQKWNEVPSLRCSATRTFSSTDRCGNTAEIWNERMMPRRAIAAGFSLVMSSPLKRMRPEVGVRNLVSRLKQVVLPAPFGPISAWMVPRRTCRLTLLTATKPLNSLVSSCVSRMKSPCAHRAASPPEALRQASAATSSAAIAVARAAIAAELRLVDADRDRGDGVAGGVEDRRAERVHAFAHRFVVDAVAALPRQGQLLEQRLDVARALAREARRELAGEAAPDLVGRQLGEHRLAAAGQIGRQAHADVEGEAERPGAVADGDVERLVARQHREQHRLLGREAAAAQSALNSWATSVPATKARQGP